MLARKEKTDDTQGASVEMTSDGLVVSEFLTKVRARFLGSGGKPLYPGKDVTKVEAAAKVIDEFPKALEAMLKAVIVGDDLPAAPKSGSALELLIAAATDADWPNGDSSIPEEWRPSSTEDLTPTFRRYEVVSAMNIMMQAYNLSGTGGGSSNFPPEKPS